MLQFRPLGCPLLPARHTSSQRSTAPLAASYCPCALDTPFRFCPWQCAILPLTQATTQNEHPSNSDTSRIHTARTHRADPCGESAADAAGLSSICVKVPSGIMRHLSASLDTPASTCPPPTHVTPQR